MSKKSNTMLATAANHPLLVKMLIVGCSLLSQIGTVIAGNGGSVH